MDNFDTIAASEKGAFLHLVEPATDALAYLKGADGKPDLDQPIGLDLTGRDSTDYRENVRNRSAKAVKKRAGKFDFSKMSEAQIVTFLEENDDTEIEDAADSVTGWKNIRINGTPVEFNRENVVMVLTKYPDVLRQIKDFLGNQANFFSEA